jgi:hypothetical protein
MTKTLTRIQEVKKFTNVVYTTDELQTVRCQIVGRVKTGLFYMYIGMPKGADWGDIDGDLIRIPEGDCVRIAGEHYSF